MWVCQSAEPRQLLYKPATGTRPVASPPGQRAFPSLCWKATAAITRPGRARCNAVVRSRADALFRPPFPRKPLFPSGNTAIFSRSRAGIRPRCCRIFSDYTGRQCTASRYMTPAHSPGCWIRRARKKSAMENFGRMPCSANKRQLIGWYLYYLNAGWRERSRPRIAARDGCFRPGLAAICWSNAWKNGAAAVHGRRRAAFHGRNCPTRHCWLRAGKVHGH